MANNRPPRPGDRGRSGQKPRARDGGASRSRPPCAEKAKAHPAAPSDGADRLQKVLAHAGLGSRRACEELILQGRVTIDGKTVRELGTKVDPAREKVAVDGVPIRLETPVYYAVNKPKGYVSTNSDPAGRPRVVDLLPEIPQRVYSVGRLDEMSVGLMILTNDGELANKLTHPKYGVEKLYRAVVAGSPNREVLDKLVEGVWLAEGKARAKRVRAVGKRGESTILEMVLAEGKNREVRRMLAKLGHKVMTLTRVAVGPVVLKGLRPGEYRPLTSREVDLLRRAADGLPVPTGAARKKTDRKPPRSTQQRTTNEAGTPPPAAPRSRSRAPSSGKFARRSATPRPQQGKGAQGRPQQEGPTSARPPRPEPPTRKIIGMPAPPSESGDRRARRPAPRRRPGTDRPGRGGGPKIPKRRRGPSQGGDEGDLD